MENWDKQNREAGQLYGTILRKLADMNLDYDTWNELTQMIGDYGTLEFKSGKTLVKEVLKS